jgi:hypothetical protein
MIFLWVLGIAALAAWIGTLYFAISGIRDCNKIFRRLDRNAIIRNLARTPGVK